MNKFEKKIAQMEKKKLHKKYSIWLYPQSDFGETVLKSVAGLHLSYCLYYNDPNESEEERIHNAKEVAKEALAYQQSEYFHHKSVGANFKIGLSYYSHELNRTMIEGVDYEMQVVEEDIEGQDPLTFSDIKPVTASI